ncbi:MAG: zinc-binding protein [Chloroflexi bacterium]|nr:MAG: zinc-binding protein [Chloroflexota bacterium]
MTDSTSSGKEQGGDLVSFQDKSCPSCRAARRASGGGGGGSYAGGGGGGYGGGQREMFTATCSNCGREARVPFQPRGDKPVYCSDCFEKMRSTRSRY